MLLLARYTEMPMEQARDQARVVPNRVSREHASALQVAQIDASDLATR